MFICHFVSHSIDILQITDNTEIELWCSVTVLNCGGECDQIKENKTEKK